LNANFKNQNSFTKDEIDVAIKNTAIKHEIKPGEILQLLRVLISGKGSGVDLLGMIELLGYDEVCKRIVSGLKVIKEKQKLIV